MDWNTIIAVIVGGLIAIVPTIINNIYQERRHKEDRQEQRREATIQAKEKWIERDILRIMDAIDNEIRMLATYREYSLDKVDFDKDKLLNEYLDEVTKSNVTKAIAYKLIYSFEEDNILNALEEYTKSLSEFRDKLLSETSDIIAILRDKNEWEIIYTSAGHLHLCLREKLISIRDTE